MAEGDIVTPYSTVKPLLGELPTWVPEYEQERIAAYDKYDDIYWGVPNAFKLVRRGDEQYPIYVPNARTIVDTTSHFLLKGLTIHPVKENKQFTEWMEQFLRREGFYTALHEGKHSGVARGDFIFHIMADPNKPEGRRVSVKTVHPGHYFPVYSADDPDKLEKVHLVEQFVDPIDTTKVYLRKLTYRYEEGTQPGAPRTVYSTEGVFELKDWFDPKKATQIKQLLKEEALHPDIDTIPVYHFRNMGWQGETFGASELRGLERLLASINQTVTDEEVALALEGLGVYATDAGGPLNEDGTEGDWEIAPARVMEVPQGAYFKRVEGVGSVRPMLDHLAYLEKQLHEGSGTTDVARGEVDVQVAQSGIALAIKFLPTMAKLEEREQEALSKLDHMFWDLRRWFDVFESTSFGELDVAIELGDKLPMDRVAILNELNNMLDRKVISREYFRTVMKAKLGYDFPDDIEQQVLDEMKEAAEAAMQIQLDQNRAEGLAGQNGTGGGDPATTKKAAQPNKSNNQGRTNESAGNEATQSSARQARGN